VSAPPAGPDPLDFLDIDALLSDEEILLRDTVRSYVEKEINPNIADWWDDGDIPHRDLAKGLGDLGVFGMHLEGYGCAGTSNVAYGLTCLELEAGDSGIRSFASVQGSLAMFAIWEFGDEDQKRDWLPPMASGEVIGAFGLTEADSGSDPAAMRAHARRDGADWVVSGSKMWITNGSIADVAVLWARTDDGVRGFITPTDSPGFSTRRIKRKASLRASVTSELILDDVRLPDEFALPRVASMRGPLSCLNEARLGVAFGAMGAARSCYETALRYAKERVQFGAPIGSFQLTQRKLVEMMTTVNRGTLLALHLGRMKDRGEVAPEQISLGKFDNVRNALEAARTGRAILGAAGITLDYPIFRHMANLESVYTYEGANEIHTLIMGRAITGMSAFKA